jgi:branched-subunit amino acid aminotransferase/4-amino-4-deoxychorismate lyase
MPNPQQNLDFPPPPKPGFWYDGSWRSGDHISLSITDPGLLYGATVFTTLRIYDDLHDPRSAWAAHRSRLTQSQTALGWIAPDWSRVESGATHMAQYWPVLRITLFPDGREWITGRVLPTDLAQRQRQGITAWVADQSIGQRSLGQHKTGNYLTPWFGLHQAQHHGAQETILTDPQGHWLETCTGSLWGWHQGTWYTPPLGNGSSRPEILPSISRDRIIRGFQCQNRSVRQIPWDAVRTASFALIAYSNCVVEIIPIGQVLNSHPIQSRDADPGLLQELFQALLAGDSQMR